METLIRINQECFGGLKIAMDSVSVINEEDDFDETFEINEPARMTRHSGRLILKKSLRRYWFIALLFSIYS